MADTLPFAVTYRHTIKKSVFIASSIPFEAHANPLEHIQTLLRDDATHNCWAYQQGQNVGFHDANEPSGTAGRPILSVIQTLKFDDIALVVSRWFGGIKLGAAGLMRAYRTTAAHCLQSAPRQPIIFKTPVHLSTRFS